MDERTEEYSNDLILFREYLLDAANKYLSRYFSSSNQLEKVLLRRVKKLPHSSREIEEKAKILIRSIIIDLQKQHIIDDLLFAEIKINYFFQRGKPLHIIYQKLKSLGLQKDIVEKAINNFKNEYIAKNENQNIDLTAAKNFAKRFRLGPYRKNISDADKIKKEFSKMARAGFSYETTRKTIKSDI